MAQKIDKDTLLRYEELMQTYKGYIDIVSILFEKIEIIKKEIEFIEGEMKKNGIILKEIENASK